MMMEELLALDLKRRGYRFDKGPLGYTIYIRDNPKIWVWPMFESDYISAKEIGDMLRRSIRLKRDLLIGVLDKESDVTYYKAGCILDDEGVGDGDDKEKESIPGDLRGEMVVVELRNLGRGARKMLEEGWFGRDADGVLYLEPLEAVYLVKRGALKSEIPKYERSHYIVYEDLRGRGFIPKAGFKYGAHFRVYDGQDNAHSRYLFHVVREDERWSWFSFSALIRLSHSVRKEMVFASVNTDKEKINYVRIERVKI